MNKKEFLTTIEDFLGRSGMAPTTFGLKAMAEPNFVFSLRNGRECREETRNKVLSFIAANDNAPETGDAA